jgi:hypothetical protein
MSDVPFAVAVLAGTAPIIAGAIPIITGALRDSRRDKLEHLEGLAAERLRSLQGNRADCAALLRLARDFRVLVQNDGEYHGPDKVAQLWKIRQHAADIMGQADTIGLMVPSLDVTADALARAVSQLAEAAANDEGVPLGASAGRPGLTELDDCIGRFKSAARTALYPELAVGEVASVRTA